MEKIDEKTIVEDGMTLAELQEQVNLRLYEIFSCPEKHAGLWESMGITQEMATKEIENYHKKFGVPDMSKLKPEK